jgi:hypothetical protein
MTVRSFIFQLIGVTTLAALLLFGLNMVFDGWRTHQDFAMAMLAAFASISATLFTLGLITARSPDKYLFHGVIMGSVLLKLIIGLGGLFIYDRKFTPLNNQFIWIFLLIYAIFTVWEVKFMTELAKTK